MKCIVKIINDNQFQIIFTKTYKFIIFFGVIHKHVCVLVIMNISGNLINDNTSIYRMDFC